MPLGGAGCGSGCDVAAGRADRSKRSAQGEIGMARTACGKNGNTADPSFHGHSTLHPVAGNGLGGLLCSAGAPDLVAAECLSLRNISTGKRNNPPVFYGSPGARSADWPFNSVLGKPLVRPVRLEEV